MRDKTTMIGYSLIGTITILLNLLEITLICKVKKKLKTYEQLLLSLAASDILVGVSSVVFGSLHSHVSATISRQIFTFMVSFTFVASLLNLLLIGVDRLAAVRFPFKHRVWVQNRKVVKAIVGIWVFLAIEIAFFSVLGALDPSKMEGSNEFYHTILPMLSVVSLIGLSILYGQICYFFVQSQKNILKLNYDLEGEATQQTTMAATAGNFATASHAGVIETRDRTPSVVNVEEMSGGPVRTPQPMGIKNGNFDDISIGKASTRAQSEINGMVEKTPVFVLNDVGNKEMGGVPRPNGERIDKRSATHCSNCRKQNAFFLTCILVLLSFIICTLPFAVQSLVSGESSLELLLIVNSLVNPMIYFFKGLFAGKKFHLRKKWNSPEPSKHLRICNCKASNQRQ